MRRQGEDEQPGQQSDMQDRHDGGYEGKASLAGLMPEKLLGDRLCAALKAGHDAGGEFKQVTSAGLLVFAEHAFAYVDLRVDDHTDPVKELARILALRLPRP